LWARIHKNTGTFSFSHGSGRKQSARPNAIGKKYHRLPFGDLEEKGRGKNSRGDSLRKGWVPFPMSKKTLTCFVGKSIALVSGSMKTGP
jgi:hypothetical protein